MTRILCWLGFHRYIEQFVPLSMHYGVMERRCVRCNYSPTWER